MELKTDVGSPTNIASVINNLSAIFPPEADSEEVARIQKLLYGIVDLNPRPIDRLWHYTSAMGLLGILGSGRIFASHVSGLNDSLDYKYFAKLMHSEALSRELREEDPTLKAQYATTAQSLAGRDVTATGSFVTCFTTMDDDLAQWRGYGGDGCAFAIAFDPKVLAERFTQRARTSLLKVIYDEARQFKIRDTVLDYHIDLLGRLGASEYDSWNQYFGGFHEWLYDTLHALIKHPKFSAEGEYRLFTKLQAGEDKEMKFGVKRSMLTRRLDLDWSADGRLPIVEVMVGPAQAQDASGIAVGDLLLQKGYQGVPVTKSVIPYQAI